MATEKTPSKPANGTPATSRKNKSTPAKKLNKKASKAKITHTDAKPGDYFMVRLKGHPAWPVIVCDESMLPEAIKKSRPVAAALPDGSYTERFADGGPRISERSFPIMFMGTNDL